MQIRQFMLGDNISVLQHMSFLRLRLSVSGDRKKRKKKRIVKYGNHVKLELIFSVHSTNFFFFFHSRYTRCQAERRSLKLLVPIVVCCVCEGI